MSSRASAQTLAGTGTSGARGRRVLRRSRRSARRPRAAATCATLVARGANRTTWSCAAGTCRVCCCRTAPSPRLPSPAAAAGRIAGGHACIGRSRHRHGARHHRPGRRAPRARRDPGRAVDRSGLDAAVPDRRRTRDGDGRRQLARRGRRARVRHSRPSSACRARRPASPPGSGSPWTAARVQSASSERRGHDRLSAAVHSMKQPVAIRIQNREFRIQNAFSHGAGSSRRPQMMSSSS